ncbi:endonuclease III [Bacteroidota bacterium]
MQKKNEKKRAIKVLDTLKNEYPDSKSALIYKNPFQLLIATILSAQCTDVRVNTVSKVLFKKYLTPADFLAVSNEELEQDIYSTGYYRQKAKNIKNCCKELIGKYNGKVPADIDKLSKLTGVGRKTASVVAGNAYGIPSVAVDTHVIRLSNLLGFIESKNAEKIEKRLKELLPENYWIVSSHLLANHGRKICVARKPKCFECVVGNFCPSFLELNK